MAGHESRKWPIIFIGADHSVGHFESTFGFMTIEFIFVHVHDMSKKVEQGYFDSDRTFN